MKSEIAILFSLISLCSLFNISADDGNPFYLEPGTLVKDGPKWTMNLRNHHSGRVPPMKGNPELMHAWVILESLDANVLHFKMNDKDGMRWEVPIVNPNPGKGYKKVQMENMGVTMTEDPFSFKILDPISSEWVAELGNGKSLGCLKYFDKYIEIGISYGNNRIFGLGERVNPEFNLCSHRTDCTYTTFSKDEASPTDYGNPPGGKNIYGHQPFYMIQQKSGQFIAVLFYNSNDQDVVMVKRAGDLANMYHKTIGGIADFYFFYSGNAEQIMQKYHDLIGKPYIPAFWSLGMHQCRYGWPNLDKVKDVVSKFEQWDIPLEVVWMDIDYMYHYRDFTVDTDRFRGMYEFVRDLHKRNMYFVPIIDAGIWADNNCVYYKRGVENNAFIKSAWTKQTLVGKVWPGCAAFPDWNVPFTTQYWHEGLDKLYKMAEFDGIWIDMNDPSNMCDGECRDSCGNRAEETVKDLYVEEPDTMSNGDPHDPHEFDNLIYYPGGKDPAHKTLSMTAYHYSTNNYEDAFYKEYNLHSLFSLYEANVTNRYFVDKLKKRPFLLTRSQFPGSGLYTSMWLGDNWSSWESMQYSIVGMFNYQMFGIPLVGADMCGFLTDTTEELCARWMQMGSFYPFTRNHNDVHAKDQEPYVFGNRVATASRNALRQKYSLLRYYFTKMFETSLYGGSMVRPLFFEYPKDQMAYENTRYTFLIGKAILVAPVLHPGLTKAFPYVTNENWWDVRTKEILLEYKKEGSGKKLELDAGFDYVNVLLQGGNIIPYQDAISTKVRRTVQLKFLPMEIIVAPNHDGVATGTLIVDKDEVINPIDTKEYRYYNFSFSLIDKKMTVEILNDITDLDFAFEKFTKVSIMAASDWAEYKKACIILKNDKKEVVQMDYTQSLKMLTLRKPENEVLWKNVKSISFDQSC